MKNATSMKPKHEKILVGAVLAASLAYIVFIALAFWNHPVIELYRLNAEKEAAQREIESLEKENREINDFLTDFQAGLDGLASLDDLEADAIGNGESGN